MSAREFLRPAARPGGQAAGRVLGRQTKEHLVLLVRALGLGVDEDVGDTRRLEGVREVGVGEKDVTREMRNAAKTINFSIMYGKTSYGLSQDLNMPIPEADQFIKNYFARYAKVKEFLDAQKEKAKKDGFLTTLLGRRSYFPNINASNMQLRQYAERSAINAPIQGSAADLIKIAMIAIQRRLEKEGSESLMIMQVHDELVFDAPAGEIDRLAALVKEEMEGAYKLNVPLKADITVGETWYKN